MVDNKVSFESPPTEEEITMVETKNPSTSPYFEHAKQTGRLLLSNGNEPNPVPKPTLEGQVGGPSKKSAGLEKVPEEVVDFEVCATPQVKKAGVEIHTYLLEQPLSPQEMIKLGVARRNEKVWEGQLAKQSTASRDPTLQTSKNRLPTAILYSASKKPVNVENGSDLSDGNWSDGSDAKVPALAPRVQVLSDSEYAPNTYVKGCDPNAYVDATEEYGVLYNYYSSDGEYSFESNAFTVVKPRNKKKPALNQDGMSFPKKSKSSKSAKKHRTHLKRIGRMESANHNKSTAKESFKKMANLSK